VWRRRGRSRELEEEGKRTDRRWLGVAGPARRRQGSAAATAFARQDAAVECCS
jgi:hypothetical protein